MKQLWAPWRIDYILGPKPDECVFCLPETPEEDTERLILYRGKYCFVIMNKFPYSNGHIMVTPYTHVSSLLELDKKQCHELIDLVHLSARVLEQAFHPPGLNIGLNMGEAAGAGIKEHLHFHLVPRWVGDHSFMAVMAEVSVLPEHLTATYDKLKIFFNTINTGEDNEIC